MRQGEPVHLLDANVLIALVLPEHQHHGRARRWFAGGPVVATSPTVQGALLRTVVRQGSPVTAGLEALHVLGDHPRHRQWLDDALYTDVDLRHVRGHRQVTDAHLAGLARRHGGRVATMDEGLGLAAPDVAVVLPG